MNHSPREDRELFQEMRKFARIKAPEIIPGLYFGLDEEWIDEVITDVLSRVHEAFPMTKHGRIKRFNHRVVGGKVKTVRKDIALLLDLLPIYEGKARKRHQWEIIHEMTFIPSGKLPSHALSMVDEASLPGEHFDENDE